MTIHICLVSQQSAPNLLPALDPELKPSTTVLVVTEKMQQQARHLAAVLRDHGIRVEELKLRNEQDFHQTEGELLDLATRLEGQTVMLNITGGTKLMSVAAQSVAELSGWRKFYVDVDTDQVIWLSKEPEPPRPLTEQLRLRQYLRSYGFELESSPDRRQASTAEQRLMRTLAQEVGSLQDAIGMLNALAQEAENGRKLTVQMSDRQRDSRSLEALLRHFEDADVLTVCNNDIHFRDEEARSFVKGGWLELLVMQALNELTGPLKLRDKAMGLTVKTVNPNGTHVKSELDAAFLARNRLFVIECKTARIDKPQGSSSTNAPKANDALFKLAENCRRIGGLGTKGMLVTYRALRPSELDLANALNIRVVAGREIARLPELIKQWVGHRAQS